MSDDRSTATPEPTPITVMGIPAAEPESPSSSGRPISSEEASELRSEAASRRRQLREAEAQRDALQARLDQRDLEAVFQLAGESMAAPKDLALVIQDMDELRDDTGAISLDLAEQVIEAALADRPHWRKADEEPAPPIPAHPVHPELHGGATLGPPIRREPTFSDALHEAMGQTGGRRR